MDKVVVEGDKQPKPNRWGDNVHHPYLLRTSWKAVKENGKNITVANAGNENVKQSEKCHARKLRDNEDMREYQSTSTNRLWLYEFGTDFDDAHSMASFGLFD
jgi:hypothetical protein